MFKKLLVLMMAVTLVFTMVACTTSKKEDSPKSVEVSTSTEEGVVEKIDVPATLKEISYNIGMTPTTLDPGLNAGTEGTMVLTQMYEGLLKEINGVMVPAMATDYTVSDDGLVYIFNLRDALWSDGVKVTAHDFEFAWSRVLDKEVASPYSWIFGSGNIGSFSAIDEKTFKVNLDSPSPVFLTLLANSTFMPLRKDIIDYDGGAWAVDPSKSVTNGAFYMSSYKTSDKLVLEKNNNYYDVANVSLDKINVHFIVDLTTALSAFESEDLDAIFAVPPTEIPRLLNEEPNFSLYAQNNCNYYAFNISDDVLSDVKIRMALTYAIDRTAICNDVLKDGSIPASSLVPGLITDDTGKSYNSWSDFGIPKDGSKIGEAQQLLADAGYPDGEGFPSFEILYNTSETNKAVAEALQQMWNTNLGINVKLTNMESAVFHQTRVANDFDITRGGWGGDYNDPLTHLENYGIDADINYANWLNDDFAKLISEGKAFVGAERMAKFREAEQILMDSYSYMPISFGTTKTLVNSDKIINWEMTSTSAPYFVNADVIQ